MKLSRMKLAAAAFLLAAAPLLSADAAEMDGWYGGMELGVAMSPGIALTGYDNDYVNSGTCDGFLGGDPSADGCSERGNDWANKFDGAAGVLSGLALGYHFRDFRIEGEYFFRTAAYDDENEPSFTGVTNLKAFREVITAAVRVGSLTSNNLFINAYYDIPLGAKTKFRPYVGAGAGWSRVSLDYSANFTRSTNLEGPLAGTATVAKETLSDDMFGYQLIAGVDYPLGDRVTLGLKFRWADYGEFKVDGKSWDRLRSHASLTGPGGDQILYELKTDDIQFWGLSLALKYRF